MSILTLQRQGVVEVVEDYKRIKEKLQATPLQFIELQKKTALTGPADRKILIQISHIESVEP